MIARRTSFTEQEVKDLFPKKVDRKELGELIKIVSAATDDNNKKAKIVSRIGDISGAVLKLGKRVFT